MLLASFGGILVAGALAGLVIVLTAGVGPRMGATYGVGLFFGTPIVAGIAAGLLSGLQPRAHFAAGVASSAIAVGSAEAVMLVTGLEGVGCLALATPVILPMGIVGGMIGTVLGRAIGPRLLRGATALALVPPLWLGVALETRSADDPAERRVTTSIEIDADPAAVWAALVAFPPIEGEPPGIFRFGIAAPIGAVIEGEGVGALRRCRFTTGDFVEPITEWDEPRALAFDVTSSPPPLREWSPWGDIDAPHLHGTFEAQRGRFDLEDLGDGRVRLTGTTWYRQHLRPAAYWGPIADSIVTTIHRRVLEHVAAVAEDGAAAPGD